MWPVRRQTSDSQPGRGMDCLTLSLSLSPWTRPCRDIPEMGKTSASAGKVRPCGGRAAWVVLVVQGALGSGESQADSCQLCGLDTVQ